MAYADYEYYTDGYLLGREPVVPEREFPYWAKQASREVDSVTFNRLRKQPDLVTDDVRDFTCAVCDLLYKSAAISDEAAANGAAGPLSSFSNDGQSGTYATAESVYTESGKKAEISRLAAQYLSGSGLLYQGFYPGEGGAC